MKLALVAVTGMLCVCCHLKNSERTVNNPSKIRLADMEEYAEQLQNIIKVSNGRSTTKNDTPKSMEKTAKTVIKWRISEKSQYTTDFRVQGKTKSVKKSGNKTGSEAIILRLNSEMQEYLNNSIEIRVQNAKKRKKNAEMQKHEKKISSQKIIRYFPGTRIRRSVGPVLDSINCTSPLSCKGRCTNKRDAGGTEKLHCSCDPYCDYFKDCCADYVQYCFGQPSTNTTALTVAIKVPDEQWTCRSGIWMIASCPQRWTNQDINTSCISRRSMTTDNYKDVIPVITADDKTYANRFCAHCHGYGLQQFKYYRMDFKSLVFPPTQATEQEKVQFLFKYAQKISSKPSDMTPRRYCYKITEKCTLIFLPEEIRKKCENGRYGLVYDAVYKNTFKNVYCKHCNYVWNGVGLQCGPGSVFETSENYPAKARSFSLIMDIGQMSSESTKTEITCPKGNVYDVYLDTCRKGKQIVPVVSNAEKYRVALWMQVKIDVPPNLILFNEKDFAEYFTQTFMLNSTAVTSVEITCLDFYKHLYLVEFDLDLSNYKPNGSHGEGYKSNLFSFWPKKKPFVLKIVSFPFDVIKNTSKPLTCKQADVFLSNEYKVLADSSSSIYVNKTGEILTARDYFSNNSKIVDEALVPVGEIVVCRQMLSVKCFGTYIFLYKHEYVIFPNRSVLYNASGHLYEYGTYMWKNRTVMICTNFTASYTQFQSNTNTNDDEVLTILTYIGFSISVVCLLFVLVTYSVFADLRTIPGVNLMNLCSAVLVAQLLWLVGSGLTFTGLGCMVIAMVLQYSFLASFWWMSIIAFNTWRAFSDKGCTRRIGTDKGKRRNHIVRTMAVGWLPLVMYVTICVTLDTSGTVAIGYGGDKGCWINNSRANLYFFAIPVGLSLFWNAVYFVLIIKEIKKTIDQSQMVASQHQARKDSRVYARIAVLMGFTWVFGFMAPFTSYYLMYPFVILNTLQGLYIAVAFGFTRRVRVLYKNRGMKKNMNVRTSTVARGYTINTIDTKL